jgi:hypothetical protein
METDMNEEYKTLGEMTDAKIGALVRAKNEGKVIEVLDIVNGAWASAPEPGWYESVAYRIRPDTPKLWGDMTPEEKGALLLAHHEGKAIEVISPNRASKEWAFCDPQWWDDYAYRVRPEPKRETVALQDGPLTMVQIREATGFTHQATQAAVVKLAKQGVLQCLGYVDNRKNGPKIWALAGK